MFQDRLNLIALLQLHCLLHGKHRHNFIEPFIFRLAQNAVPETRLFFVSRRLVLRSLS